MIDISILRAMVAAGAPVEAILLAVEADQKTEKARRLKDAQRKRLERERKSMDVQGRPDLSMDVQGRPGISMDVQGRPGISMDVQGRPGISMDVPKTVDSIGQFQTSRDVTRNEFPKRLHQADILENPDVTFCGSRCNLEVTLSSSTKILEREDKKEKERKTRARARVHKTLLADDWSPKPAHYAKGERAFIERKAEDMRNWAKSKGVMRVDWDATFHGFLRPRESKQGHTNGAGASLMDAFDSLIADAKKGAGDGDGPLLDLTPTRSSTS